MRSGRGTGRGGTGRNGTKRDGWALLAALTLLAACGGSAIPPTDERSGPASIAPIIEKAERLRARGDFDTAIAAYREALERTPWNDRIKRALASTHGERAARRRTEGDRAAAETDLRAALELYPDDVELQRNLGVVLIERSLTERDPERARALRQESARLAPGLDPAGLVLNAGVERRLDLALELVERGQVEAGVDALERLHVSEPRNDTIARLLAEARVRLATELAGHGNHVGAGRVLDRAVEVYRELDDCVGDACAREDLRVAHHNRAVAWINAGEAVAARRALDDAAAAGMLFPRLDREVAALGSR